MRRYKSPLSAVLLAILLVACGGGDDDAAKDDQVSKNPVTPPPADQPVPSSPYPTFDEAAAGDYRQRREFRYSEPGASSEASIRAQSGLPPICAGSPNANCVSAVPLALQNVDFAHTAKTGQGDPVTGKGRLIAIIDDGFRLSHRELAGKNILAYPGQTTLPKEDHGTAVAALAAGKADGQGMMGVAPDADLHLSSWASVPDEGILQHLSAATRHAAAHGAVVQNNSWGWTTQKPAREEAEDFAASGASDYAEYIATRHGGHPVAWRDLFAAYDAFQENGVIVMANSNDHEMDDATAWAALPEFVKPLAEAWIVAANAQFAVDSETGDILAADLLSAPCGSTAPYCLTSEGTVRAPSDNGDAAYLVGTGTSFAAPQISGGIALLAQAFPNLSPREWTKRLLASARRDWPGFRSTIAGETRFAKGVRRSYSSLFGHGVPDVKAALSPIGGLSIPFGKNVFEGKSSPVSAGMVLEGPIIGNAIHRALAGKELMVVDSLGSNFALSGDDLHKAVRAARPRQGVEKTLSQLRELQRLDFLFSEQIDKIARLEPLHELALTKLHFSHRPQNAQQGASFSKFFTLGENDHLQFSGWISDVAKARGAGFTVGRNLTLSGVTAQLDLSIGHEDKFFGIEHTGPFLAASGSSTTALAVSATRPLGRWWSTAGFAEFGSVLLHDASDSLTTFRPIAYSSGGLSLYRHQLFTSMDMLGFHAGVRPTTIAGEASVKLPVARDRAGNIRYEAVTVDLSKADVPVRLGLSYSNTFTNNLKLGFAADTEFTIRERPRSIDLGLQLKQEF